MVKTNDFRLADITAREFFSFQNDPDLRLTSTPLGAAPGEDRIVVSSAVGWKNKGEEAMPEEAQAGLKEAKEIAEGCEEVEGTVAYHGRTITARNKCMIDAAA